MSKAKEETAAESSKVKVKFTCNYHSGEKKVYQAGESVLLEAKDAELLKQHKVVTIESTTPLGEEPDAEH